jgi:hypothetical protein
VIFLLAVRVADTQYISNVGEFFMFIAEMQCTIAQVEQALIIFILGECILLRM